jgi:hypothetical protein
VRALRPNSETGDDRLWRTLLVTGAVAGFLLLGWQVTDYALDAAHPAFRKNDLTSALGSVAMLAIVGIIAARRAQLRKTAAVPAAPVGRSKPKPKTAKRAAASTRRKRRA